MREADASSAVNGMATRGSRIRRTQDGPDHGGSPKFEPKAGAVLGGVDLNMKLASPRHENFIPDQEFEVLL